jgi:hypothetical protein
MVDRPELLEDFKKVMKLQVGGGLFYWSGHKYTIQSLFDVFPAIEELVLGRVMRYSTERLIPDRNPHVETASQKVFTKHWTSYTTSVKLVPIAKVKNYYKTLELVKYKSNRARSVGNT